MEKKVIFDPLCKIEFDGHIFNSLITLYVERRDLCITI